MNLVDTKEPHMKNTLNWFEIFVTDMSRAKAFYEVMLETNLRIEVLGGEPSAIFPEDGAAGSLVQRAGRQPSAEGALVYFNCNQRLDECLARVNKAGGQIAMPKTDIGPPGFIAMVIDTEGNTVGLHTERE
jgi:predicted enzyme related to lactoylglutathione lyase